MNWSDKIDLSPKRRSMLCRVSNSMSWEKLSQTLGGDFKKACHTFYWQTRVSSNRFISQPLPLCLVLVICRYLAHLMVCLLQLYNLWQVSKISQQRLGPYQQLSVSGFWDELGWALNHYGLNWTFNIHIGHQALLKPFFMTRPNHFIIDWKVVPPFVKKTKPGYNRMNRHAVTNYWPWQSNFLQLKLCG